MKINRQKINIALPILLILLLLTAAYLVFAKYYGYFPFGSGNRPDSVSEDVKQNTPSKPQNTSQNKAPDAKQQPTNDLPQNSESTTTEEVPTNDELSVTITKAEQSNGNVTAEASTSSSGTCVFQYTTPDDKPVIRESQSENGTCKSSIREDYFAKLGQWKLKVTYYNNGMKTEDDRDVTIN